MISFVSGDFFDFDADIRVNTVNCVGVMGAGVALAFKKKYPEMYKDYVYRCKSNELKPGKPQVWRSADIFGSGIEIINFPTKNHWRRPSKYEYIEEGLVWLSDFLSNRPNSTVTLPALGCGHGGLDWKIVKELILKHLHSTPANVLVFEPSASKNLDYPPPLPSELEKSIIQEKLIIVSEDSKQYPAALRAYTKKDLYVYGNIEHDIFFDVSIISSTKPDTDEKSILKALLVECRNRKLTVLFGGSSLDKNLALQYAEAGLPVGVFLPSGILISAKNLQKNPISNLTLLSIGSPNEGFNRKEYLPSVTSRLLLGATTIFTTKKLEWISKQNNQFLALQNNLFFVSYVDLSESDIQAAINANLIAIEPDSISILPSQTTKPI